MALSNETKLSLGIKQSFALVAAMVKARPCLKIDFQVYLRNDGTVLNIDLDRCDDPISKQNKIRSEKTRGLCVFLGSNNTLKRKKRNGTSVNLFNKLQTHL